MSDNATLRRLLREHAEAVSTEIAIIKEDAILRLFDAVQNEYAAQVAALQAALEEEGHRNAVFTACLHKAQNLYLEAHPDYPGWPDGAVNITWVLEAFDKERAEVKRLQTALAAANEDAERLAAGDGSVTGFHITYCRYCSKGFERGSRAEIRHAANCPITLHRARVGAS